MTDVFDRATEQEESLREAALQEQARHDSSRGKTIEDSATHCQVCGEPISEGRRRAVLGVQTCFDCQRDLELELRKYR